MRESFEKDARWWDRMSAWGCSFSPNLITVVGFFPQLLISQLQGISLKFPSMGKMRKRWTAVDFYVIYLPPTLSLTFKALKQISGGISPPPIHILYTHRIIAFGLNGALVLYIDILYILLYLMAQIVLIASSWNGPGLPVSQFNVNGQIQDKICCDMHCVE